MSTPCDLFGSDGLFGPASESNNLFGCVTTNEDRKSSNTLSKKSCFSTPKLTRQYANPPTLNDKKEYSLKSPEGKEILNDPGEVRVVDGKTIVFNSTCPWEQDAYIVLPDTNPLTKAVMAMHNNLMKQRKTSRETENVLHQEINAVKKHSLEALAKQEYVLKKEHAHKDYARKRRRITTNLNDEFTKATGYSTW
jgi:hypothetical protein